MLPETAPQEAVQIAERIRCAVAGYAFEVETSSEPIHATVSLGVASYPRDGQDAKRARAQGRPRRVPGEAPGSKPRLRPLERAGARGTREPRAAPRGGARGAASAGARTQAALAARSRGRRRRADRRVSRPHNSVGPRFFWMPRRLAILVAVVGTAGLTLGVVGAITGGEPGRRRPDRDRRPRRHRSGALDRGRAHRHDLGDRRGCARGRSDHRHTWCALARADDRRHRLDDTAQRLPSGALQRRRAHVRDDRGRRTSSRSTSMALLGLRWRSPRASSPASSTSP